MAPRSGEGGPGGVPASERGAGSTDLPPTANPRARRPIGDGGRGQDPAQSRNQLRDLIGRARGGDASARTALFEVELGMVGPLVRTVGGPGGPGEEPDPGLFDELFQEGAAALVTVINELGEGDVLDERALTRLAAGRVRAAIESARAAAEAARADQEGLLAAATDHNRVSSRLARSLGREPSIRELAENLEWTVERAEAVGAMVAEARRAHDLEVIQYLDPDSLGVEGTRDRELD